MTGLVIMRVWIVPICSAQVDAINLATKYTKPITHILKSTHLAHLVHLRLPELVRALVDPDVGGLHVLLDRVDHRALLVHHRRQVLEDGVHVDDVGLQEEGNFMFELH